MVGFRVYFQTRYCTLWKFDDAVELYQDRQGVLRSIKTNGHCRSQVSFKNVSDTAPNAKHQNKNINGKYRDKVIRDVINEMKVRTKSWSEILDKCSKFQRMEY